MWAGILKEYQNGEPLSLAEINAIKSWVNQFWDDFDVASIKAYKLEKKY